MLEIQYDLFKDHQQSESDALRNMIMNVKESNDKVRKGLWARHGELFKMINEMSERLNIIERNICNGRG